MVNLEQHIRRAQGRDLDAFDALTVAYQDMLYATACARLKDPELAQDAAQEALLDAFLSLPKLREPKAFGAWLRKIVFKHCDRLTRQRQPRMLEFDDLARLAVDPQSPPEPEGRLSAEQPARIKRELEALPAALRLTATLFYISGQSHADIAAYLQVPASTVKKRLHDARLQLKKRMSTMLTLEKSKPSHTAQFSETVQFFLSVRAGDTHRVRALLDKRPALVNAPEKWNSEDAMRQLLPFATGQTPLIRAAQDGNLEMLELLLARGAQVGSLCACNNGEQPLHAAALTGNARVIDRLLREKADVNARSGRGYTPLHLAVMRESPPLAAQLLRHNADVNSAGPHGLTALHWAAVKGSRELCTLLLEHHADPRALDASGRTAAQIARRYGHETLAALLDRGAAAQRSPTAAAAPTSSNPPELRLAPSQFVTGIKVIDLFCPLKLGGWFELHGGFGLGRFVILAELIRRFSTALNAKIIWAGVEERFFWLNEIETELKEFNLEHVTRIYAKLDDAGDVKRSVAARALALARQHYDAGEHVLVLADRSPRFERQLQQLIAARTAGNRASITVLVQQSVTDALPPEKRAQRPDARIVLERRLRPVGLYPAVDPVRSSSALHYSTDADRQVARVVQSARSALKTLRRLCPALTAEELQALPAKRRPLAVRFRKLQLFLTQPFHVTEFFLCAPGESVPFETTLRTCERILAGELDSVPEQTFLYRGALE